MTTGRINQVVENEILTFDDRTPSIYIFARVNTRSSFLYIVVIELAFVTFSLLSRDT